MHPGITQIPIQCIQYICDVNTYSTCVHVYNYNYIIYSSQCKGIVLCDINLFAAFGFTMYGQMYNYCDKGAGRMKITQCTSFNIHVHVSTCKRILLHYTHSRQSWEKGLNIRSFTTHSKLNFYLKSFAAMPTLMFVHAHFYNIKVWLIMWECSRKVEAVLLAVFVLFLSPAMFNLDRNTDRNNTSTSYTCKTTIQFWRLSIVNQSTSKSNIDKNMSEPSVVFADEVSKAVFHPAFAPALILHGLNPH